MDPLPEDDGRKPSDQQAWTYEHRHSLTQNVDERARNAIETYMALPEDPSPFGKQRARYAALKVARDRALVFVLAYTAVRVGELLQDPNDPRRRGVRWEEVSLYDGSMDVYRKKQQWDAVSLSDPVISPLRSYRKLMDPPTEHWPVFPTFDQRTLATLVQDEPVPPRGGIRGLVAASVLGRSYGDVRFMSRFLLRVMLEPTFYFIMIKPQLRIGSVEFTVLLEAI